MQLVLVSHNIIKLRLKVTLDYCAGIKVIKTKGRVPKYLANFGG